MKNSSRSDPATTQRRYIMAFNAMLVLMVVRGLGFYFPAIGESPHRHIVYGCLVFLLIAIAFLTYRMTTTFKTGGLATNGIYRYVAHPAYMLYVIYEVSFAVFIIQPSVANTLTSAAYIAIIVVTAYYEERNLMDGYGLPARKHFQRTVSVHSVLRLLRLLEE